MESKTFWLARDKCYAGDYKIKFDEPMVLERLIRSEYFKGADVIFFPRQAKKLGLDIIKKGEQSQLRRTPQGWEVVR